MLKIRDATLHAEMAHSKARASSTSDHWMTSSARCIGDGGLVEPSVFAIVTSNFTMWPPSGAARRRSSGAAGLIARSPADHSMTP